MSHQVRRPAGQFTGLFSAGSETRAAPTLIRYLISPIRSTEVLLYFMIIFSPWAFGTTQPWSIWTMNICGYALGCLLVVKFICRSRANGESPTGETGRAGWSMVDLVAGGLDGAIVAYCLCAAVNARANYDQARQTFDYYDNYVSWLPHSYDRDRSFGIFWNYLGLALAFWAVHDWLVTDQGSHSDAASGPIRSRERLQVSRPTPRLTRLLWVLVVNGALLAMEGLIQRADGGAKLLWFMDTRINREAASQFGPYAYRSNAAQYFNMLWPAMLGFWCWCERAEGRGGVRVITGY